MLVVTKAAQQLYIHRNMLQYHIDNGRIDGFGAKRPNEAAHEN